MPAPIISQPWANLTVAHGAGWLGIAPALLLAMLTAGVLGVVIERVAYRPMLAAPRLAILITSLAVSMVLETSVLAVTGRQIEAFSTDLGFSGGGEAIPGRPNGRLIN